MMSIFVAIGLGVLALAFVLYPLYRGLLVKPLFVQPTTGTVVSDGIGNTTMERTQLARAALQEVELDYQLGNISEADYNTLRERYMRRALVALKAHQEREQNDAVTQEYSHDKDLDDLIEEQLRKLKENESNATE